MRARIAYISSLGTTAILVAAALLMLALVGALVAFRGWPGSANGAVVQQVPLGPGSGAARTVLVRPVAARSRIVRVRSFSALAVTRARVSTAGLVKEPAPAAVKGVVMEPASTITMSPSTPQPGGASAHAEPAQSPVAAPGTPTPDNPTGVPASGNPVAGIPLLDPGAPGPLSGQAPSGDQIPVMVGALVGSV